MPDGKLDGTVVLVSRMLKSGTGDNNFVKWKGTFLVRLTFKGGPRYSVRTEPKWSVPFDF